MPIPPIRICSDTNNQFVDDTSHDVEHRVSGAGKYVGLDVFVRFGGSPYVSYGDSFYGVSILLHGPEDFPLTSDRAAYGQPGDDVTVAVIPTVVVSEASVRGLPLRQRECYFDDELNLSTTSKYTYKLCMTECTANTVYSYCGCLPFYYPEVRKYRATDWCGI